MVFLRWKTLTHCLTSNACSTPALMFCEAFIQYIDSYMDLTLSIMFPKRKIYVFVCDVFCIYENEMNFHTSHLITNHTRKHVMEAMWIFCTINQLASSGNWVRIKWFYVQKMCSWSREPIIWVQCRTQEPWAYISYDIPKNIVRRTYLSKMQ